MVTGWVFGGPLACRIRADRARSSSVTTPKRALVVQDDGDRTGEVEGREERAEVVSGAVVGAGGRG